MQFESEPKLSHYRAKNPRKQKQDKQTNNNRGKKINRKKKREREKCSVAVLSSGETFRKGDGL